MSFVFPSKLFGPFVISIGQDATIPAKATDSRRHQQIETAKVKLMVGRARRGPLDGCSLSLVGIHYAIVSRVHKKTWLGRER